MPPYERQRLAQLDEFGGYGDQQEEYGGYGEEDPYLAELEAEAAQQYEPQQYQGSFLEDFGGLERQQFPQPQSFGSGLLTGLVGGIGRAGTQRAQARQRFEEGEAERRKQFDVDRRAASRELRSLTGQERRAKINADLAAKKDQEKYERDNPLVDDALVAAHPDIPGLSRLKGRRVEKSFIDRYSLEAPERKERSSRQDAAAARAEATAQRSAAAAEQSARTASLNAYDKLQANRAAEPAIKGYEGVRSNLITAESGAKEKSGPGDIALIYSWHRSLEPDKPNVVREGDVALTREAISALQRAYNVPARFFSGSQLTDPGREYFLRQMRNALKAREADYRAVNDQYRATAKAFGQDPTMFIRDVSPGAPAQYQPGGFFDTNRPGAR